MISSREPEAPHVLRDAVLAELRLVMGRETQRAQRHGPHVQELWELSAQKIGGGKLLRPLLLLETLEAFAQGAPGHAAAGIPVDSVTAVRCAAALEILHYAFLLHDDVIDHDLVRRGEDNLVGSLHRRGRARQGDGAEAASLHWARSAGILMGDLLLALAHQLLARLDLPDAARAEVLDLLGHAVAESAAGEFLDVGLADGMISPASSAIATMTRTKTATYSIELPLALACVLAGAPDPVRQVLRESGQHIGIAFQLQDDALSAVEDEERHGKDPYSDFREGKQTRVIDLARDSADWPGISALLGRADLTPQQGRHLRALLVRCGARDRVRAEILEHLDQARLLLAEPAAGVPAPVVAVLERLIGRLQGRRR